eukprot:6119681-Pleurochrysis_carterae.AAC.1
MYQVGVSARFGTCRSERHGSEHKTNHSGSEADADEERVSAASKPQSVLPNFKSSKPDCASGTPRPDGDDVSSQNVEKSSGIDDGDDSVPGAPTAAHQRV